MSKSFDWDHEDVEEQIYEQNPHIAGRVGHLLSRFADQEEW